MPGQPTRPFCKAANLFRLRTKAMQRVWRADESYKLDWITPEQAYFCNAADAFSFKRQAQLETILLVCWPLIRAFKRARVADGYGKVHHQRLTTVNTRLTNG